MKPSAERKYTCSDYRDEMRLLALKRRLQQNDLSAAEKERLGIEIRSLERAMAMD